MVKDELCSVRSARVHGGGFDPTSNRFTNERYVVLSLGRDYSDCSPVTGIRRGGGEDTLSVNVSVRALDPEPGQAGAADEPL